MDALMQLRHCVWDVRKKLMHKIRKEQPSNTLKNFTDELSKMLKDIDSKLDALEYDLQVPGGVLEEGFEKSIKDGLVTLGALLKDNNLEEALIKRGEDLLKGLSPMVSKEDSLISPLEVEVHGEINVDKIVESILSSNSDDKHVFAIPIVGERTATMVAQRVYHDPRVQHEFELRHWVCMGDVIFHHSSELLDLFFNRKRYDFSILDEYLSIVRHQRYLLILDGIAQTDLWNFLSDLLHEVKPGSVIIFSASNLAAIGNLDSFSKPNGAPFEFTDQVLQQQAWTLFEKVAFKDEGKERDESSLDIGKKICMKYANVPRLLKLIASFLSKKEVKEWKGYYEHLLASLQDPSQNIMSKLNFGSQEDVISNMDQCESYCSLFPENYEFGKDDLIHLWESQGYLQTATEWPEELVGEDYFGELLKSKYFFENTSNGIVMSYKMQDLVNEFLKGLEKPEYCFVKNPKEVIDNDDIRHLCFVVDSEWKEELSSKQIANKLQSLLFLPKKFGNSVKVSSLEDMLLGLTCLRSLDLVAVNCENFPSSLWELQELRYLRLGVSSKSLPTDVTKLQKLQTLDLRHSGIIKLPDDFHKLSNLRHLYTGGKLMEMPKNFREMTSLRTLDVYIAKEQNGLEELGGLKGLVGKLTICYDNNPRKIVVEGISNDMSLKELPMKARSALKHKGEATYDLPHLLEPPPGLKSITICSRKVKMASEELLFRNAVFNSLSSVHIEELVECKGLQALSTLPYLKSLELWDLGIFYIDNDDERDEGKTSTPSSRTKRYFPSLEHVMLANLPNLEAWSRKILTQQHPIPSHHLSIKVTNCPKMRSMPPLRSLVTLEAHNINWKLLGHLLATTSLRETLSPWDTLMKLQIISVADLGPALSITNLRALKFLTIRKCSKLKELAFGPSNCLQKLEIHECGDLVQIKCVPEKVSSLETLEIKGCEKLELINSSEERVWKCFKNLRSLKLINIIKLQSLKSALSSLENLEVLSLHSIYQLRALSEDVVNLKQLRQLVIRNCPFLLPLPESLSNRRDLKRDIMGCPKIVENKMQEEAN